MSFTWDGMKAGENTLIPPDEPEEPEDPCILKLQSKGLTRWEYESGGYGWKKSDRFLAGYEADLYEEAYQLGLQQGEEQGYATQMVHMP